MGNSVATYEKPSTLPSIAGFESRVALITVVDQDTYDLATDDIRYFKDIAATWEAERVRRKQPIDAIAKQLQDDFMPVITAAKMAETTIKGMQKTFLISEERKRLAAQAEVNRIAAAAAAQAEKEAAVLAKKGKVAEAAAVREMVAVTVPVTVAPTAMKSAGTSTPKKWKGKIKDTEVFLAYVAKNPAYWALVEILQGSIDRMIHASKGQIVLPGVENYEDFDIRVGR